MHPSVYASIALIAAQVIAGKAVTVLYDFSLRGTLEIGSLPNASRLKEFHKLYRDCLPGYAHDGRYQFTITESGQTLEMIFNGTSFICRILGSTFYFIGNVHDNAIYIFDHALSSVINLRISGCRAVEHDNKQKVSSADWLEK